jgi:hypothetical protein
LFDETSRFGGEVGMSLGLKDIDGRSPAALDFLSSLSQCGLARLYADIACEQFICHRLRARTGLRGIASKRRTVNAICLVDSGLAADRALRSVGGNALLAKVTGELMSPRAQGRLPDVKTHALFERIHRAPHIVL